MKGKRILATILALAMVFGTLAFLATPAAAADPQTTRGRCYTNENVDGQGMFYTNLAGEGGFMGYWSDKPAGQAADEYRGVGTAGLVYLDTAPMPGVRYYDDADGMYGDPSGWLYFSRMTYVYENASSGYCTWMSRVTDNSNPYDFPYVNSTTNRIPVAVATTSVGDYDVNWAPAPSVIEHGVGVDAESDAQFAGYILYRSTNNATWNDNAAMGPVVGALADITWVAGTEAAPIVGTNYLHVGGNDGTQYYYYLQYVFVGGAAIGNQAASYGGWGYPSEVVSLGTPPEVTVSGDAGNHDGNVLFEQVQVTCTVDDSMHTGAGEPNNINGAYARITTPTAFVINDQVMTLTSGGGTPIETYAYDFSWDSVDMIANGIVEGTYDYEMRGSDDVDGFNLTYSTLAGTFDIVDTTAPLCDFVGATPPDGAFRQTGAAPGYAGGQLVTIQVDYEDFTPWSAATLYYWNVTEGFRFNSVAMVEVAFSWSSYLSTLEASFNVYGFPLVDTIFYEVDVADSSAGGPIVTTSAQQTIIPFAAAAQPQDPYPIYGYTFQYDGTIAAGYGPTLITGCTVDVTWANTSSGAWSTITYTDALATGQYEVDILNYSEGGVVFCNVTVNPVWGNLGYNYTYVEALGAFPGGREQNITCGVPYNISWLQPIPLATVTPGIPFSLEWVITDINGLLAPGYYNTALETPDRGFVNITAGPIPPVLHSYIAPADVLKDGTLDPDPGHFISLIPAGMTIYFPVGLWWLNVSEGGQIFADTFYLTPWDSWWLDPGLTIPGWLKDWDNITINVLGWSFDWELIAGWNLVSCPQNFTHRVDANPYMDAQDALNWTNLYMINNLALPGDPALEIADNIGGVPSAYASYALDTGEGGAFMMDCQHSYWVWTDLAGPNIINFISLNETTNAGDNLTSVDLVAGWNMMGFQHNYTAWTTIPTASMFTDATVDISGALDIAGPLWRIIVTEWTDVKWYNSCVVTDWFPVMADKNWLWDFSYSAQPGNGVWIWIDTGVTITYRTVF